MRIVESKYVSEPIFDMFGGHYCTYDTKSY